MATKFPQENECRAEYGDAHDAHMALNGECPWCGLYDETRIDEGVSVEDFG